MIDLPWRQLKERYASAAPDLATCELCGLVIPDRHRHVYEPATRAVLCACQACSILFVPGNPDARFRTVPDRVLADPQFTMDEQQWATVGVPVGLVVFVRRAGQIVACYPGPAGVTETELAPQAWNAIVAATSLASRLEDDVEGLLIHRDRGHVHADCFLIPITAAYELTGMLRTTWRGFSGGAEARSALAAFVTGLHQRGASR